MMSFEKSHDRHEINYSLHNTDGDLIATIFFVNGVFERVWFGFKGNYSREQWKVLAQIEKQISKIERSLDCE